MDTNDAEKNNPINGNIDTPEPKPPTETISPLILPKKDDSQNNVLSDPSPTSILNRGAFKIARQDTSTREKLKSQFERSFNNPQVKDIFEDFVEIVEKRSARIKTYGSESFSPIKLKNNLNVIDEEKDNSNKVIEKDNKINEEDQFFAEKIEKNGSQIDLDKYINDVKSPRGQQMNLAYWKQKIVQLSNERQAHEKEQSSKFGSNRNLAKVAPSPRVPDDVPKNDDLYKSIDQTRRSRNNAIRPEEDSKFVSKQSAQKNYQTLNIEKVLASADPNLKKEQKNKNVIEISDHVTYNFSSQETTDADIMNAIREKIKGEVNTLYGVATPEQLELIATQENKIRSLYFVYAYTYVIVVFFSISWFFYTQASDGIPLDNDKINGVHLEYIFTFLFSIDLVLFIVFRWGEFFWRDMYHDRKDLFYTFLGIIPAVGCIVGDNYIYVIFQTIRQWNLLRLPIQFKKYLGDDEDEESGKESKEKGLNMILQILLIFQTFCMIFKNIAEETDGFCEFLSINEIVCPPVNTSAYNLMNVLYLGTVINLLGGHDEYAPYNLQIRMFICLYQMYYIYFIISRYGLIVDIMTYGAASNKACTPRTLVIFLYCRRNLLLNILSAVSSNSIGSKAYKRVMLIDMNKDNKFQCEVWYYKSVYENLKFSYSSSEGIDFDNLAAFQLKNCSTIMFLNDSFICEPYDFERDRVFLNYIYLSHCQDPSKNKIVQVNNRSNINIIKSLTEYHPNTYVYSPQIFKIKLLVQNMFSQGSMKIWQDLMLSNYMLYPTTVNIEVNSDWYKEHNRSVKQDIHYVKFDPFFIGKSFNEACRLIYSSKNKGGFNGPLLIGVIKIEKSTKRKKFYINPTNLTIEKEHRAIVLSEEEPVALMVEKFMENYFDPRIVKEYKNINDDLENHINNNIKSNSSSENILVPIKDSFVTPGTKRPIDSDQTNAKLISSELNGPHNGPTKVDKTTTLRNAVASPGKKESPINNSEIDWRNRNNKEFAKINQNNLVFSKMGEEMNVDIDKFKELHYIEELQDAFKAYNNSLSIKRKPKLSNNYYVLWNNDLRGLIEGHIIVVGSKPILFDIVKEIRAISNRPICFIDRTKPSTEWKRILLHFDDVFYLQGDPLSCKELRNSSLETAFHCMIFCNPKMDSENFQDHESFILINTLKNQFDVPYSFELTYSEMMKFVRMKDQKLTEDQGYIYWPDYLNGLCLISQHVEDLPAAQPKKFNNLEFFCEMFNDKENAVDTALIPLTIKVPECFYGKKMKEVFNACQRLEEHYLPIGIITSKFCKPKAGADLASGQMSANFMDSEQPQDKPKVMNSVSRYKEHLALQQKAKASYKDNKNLEIDINASLPPDSKNMPAKLQDDLSPLQSTISNNAKENAKVNTNATPIIDTNEANLQTPLGNNNSETNEKKPSEPYLPNNIEQSSKCDHNFPGSSSEQHMIECAEQTEKDFMEGNLVILKPLSNTIIEKGDSIIVLRSQQYEFVPAEGEQDKDLVNLHVDPLAEKATADILNTVIQIAISVNKEKTKIELTEKDETTLSRIQRLISAQYDEKTKKKDLEIARYNAELKEAVDCYENGKLDIGQSITALLRSKEKFGAKRYRTPSDGLVQTGGQILNKVAWALARIVARHEEAEKKKAEATGNLLNKDNFVDTNNRPSPLIIGMDNKTGSPQKGNTNKDSM